MYKKLRFFEGDLAGDLFYPDPKKSSSVKSAGLYLFGLPSFIGQNEITYSLIRNQMISVQPHYFGTFDSGNQFSPEGVPNTVRKIQDIFDRGHINSSKGKFELNTNLEICIGHSFGTFAALRGVRYLKSLRLLILLAPTVHYRKEGPNYGNKADGMSILKNIQKENPYTYRLANLEDWQDVMNGDDPLPLPEEHPALERVIAVAGKEDAYLDLKALEQTLPLIVSAYCGEKAKLSLIAVPDAGHMLVDLVDSGSFSLEKTISSLQ